MNYFSTERRAAISGDRDAKDCTVRADLKKLPAEKTVRKKTARNSQKC
jgi:hypothetical protein